MEKTIKSINLHKDRKEYNIKCESIDYIKAYSGEVEIKVRDIIFRKDSTLDEMEKILPESDFFRVSRSYIVNLSSIAYEIGSSILKIGDVEIPISRRRKNEFIRRFMEKKLGDCIVK